MDNIVLLGLAKNISYADDMAVSMAVRVETLSVWVSDRQALISSFWESTTWLMLQNDANYI